MQAMPEALHSAYRMDETTAVQVLLDYVNFSGTVEDDIQQLALQLVESVREHQSDRSVIEAFMLQYDLSMQEGTLMMCLAEALLRVPDKQTEQLLLKDKLTSAAWNKHLGESESFIVNMATWGLTLSGKVLQDDVQTTAHRKLDFKSVWHNLLRRSGEPVIRKAAREAMKLLSKQFVIGENMEDALKQSKKWCAEGYRFSYDMLGEVARTQKDADRYFTAYYDAITVIGKSTKSLQQHPFYDLFNGPSISVKLSALHPRYEYSHRDTVVPYLIERMTLLALHAKENHMSLTIDAEEADRLEMSLDIIAALFMEPKLVDWEGLGLALQAYQKRAFYVLDWLIALAHYHGKRFQVRLVKGAYWDTEIKLTQVEGLSDYPVFTRKVNTDLSYLACAKKMLSAQNAIYPQFATHNAYSIAAILTLLEGKEDHYHFEFQSLQGMGRALHNEIVSKKQFNLPSRIYAPVGSHKDLLPYLVRRLLENGANSSFVNRISDASVSVEKLIESPIRAVKKNILQQAAMNPRIVLPKKLYGESRFNSAGLDFSSLTVQSALQHALLEAEQKTWVATPFLRPLEQGNPVCNPANREQIVGMTEDATLSDVESAMQKAMDFYPDWARTPLSHRVAILRKAADIFEAHQHELMYLLVVEAGKTLKDAQGEIREAVDFCRYYALQAEENLVDTVLPGPTGEHNVLRLHGRGVIVCISPWNFPLAIFTGQIVAALVAGNVVVAKPAEQTTLIGALAVRLLYDAGLPETALQYIPGRGETVGRALVEHAHLAGVIFTGSTETARLINLSLAQRPGAILPLIAETGGINAMIADSTALAEQLVRDVIVSAFGSAGQRCSALRLLCVQADIADNVIEMLKGAMAEMTVGDPLLLSTDVGPVIDDEAQKMLLAHIDHMRESAHLIASVPLQLDSGLGYFVAPHAFELSNISLLEREIFGPVLHVVRYAASDLDGLIDQINQLGYGLTFGVESRIGSTVDYIQRRIHAGNIYVNRNMIGAVVGVQPFGGHGLSGTGPKAGGPHYLTRLCHESTLTVDTTAVGGNASLMAMGE